MAGESLRDLVVSLSLDSDNFQRNIKTVNTLIKETDSAFKLAAAGMKDFESTTAGQAAKLDSLRHKYTLQEKAISQFAGALQAAEAKLASSRNSHLKYSAALDEAGRKVREAAQNVEQAKREYEAVARATDKNSNAALEAKAVYEGYKKELSDAEKEHKKLKSQLDRTEKSMQNNADAVTKAKTALNNAEAAAKSLRAEMAKLESGAWQAGVWFTNLGAGAEIAGRSLERAGRFLTTYVSAPMLAMGAASLKASIDFETAFTGVRKTVDATQTQYRHLAGSIKEMSGEVADSAENIASVVATAGQLGIANDQLMNFTRTVEDLTVSTEDLKGTEAATEIAKFANVAQMAQDEVDNLGSSITYLGNNYATTEGAIMEMALNIAAAGKQVGLTEAEILGLAAGLSSVGLEADKGGTAMSKALKQMEVAAVTGGEALDDFARISGVTAEEFKAIWENDPAGAFMMFIDGLARMDEEGISAIATMQEIGMSEVRLSDTMLRTVNAQELFTSAIADSNRAWEENSALTEEANKFYSTTESKLKNLGNRAKNFGARLGDDLNPQMQNLIGHADSLLTHLENLDGAQVRAITRVASWAGVVGPAALGLGKFTLAAGDASKGVGKFLKEIGRIRGESAATGKSFLSLASSTLGFKAGMVSLGVTLAAGAAALIYYTSNAYKMKAAIEGMQDTVNDWKNSPSETLFSGEGMSFFGLTDEDFTAMNNSARTMQQWRDGLVKVWTDGQKETNDIVNEWTQSFADITDTTRQELLNLKQETGGEGSFIGADIDKDIAALDEIDKTIADLLKKRQNGLFTEDDMETLQDAIDRREAIVVKYSLQEATGRGYEEIARGINDEIARAALEGRQVDMSVYEKGTKAAAEGYALITQELENQYDIQRRILEAEGDREALDALDAEYLEKRKLAAQEYMDIMSQTADPVLDTDELKETEEEVAALKQLLSDLGTADTEEEKVTALKNVEDFFANVDKDDLVEYIALVQQITDAADAAGMTGEEIESIFGTDYTKVLTQLAEIEDYLTRFKDEDEIKPIKDAFDLAVDEVRTIAVELDRDDLMRQLDDFEKDPAAMLELPATIVPTGADGAALEQWKKNNPVEIEAQVRLGGIYDDPSDALADETAKFFDENGVELNVEDINASDLTKGLLVLLTESEDGTIYRNVIITAEAGNYETGEILGILKENEEGYAPAGEFMTGMQIDLSTLGHVESALERIKKITGDGFLDKLFGYSPEQFDQSLQNDFSQEDIGWLSEFVSDVYSRLEEGSEVSEEEIAALQNIIDLLNALSAEGVGTNIVQGIQMEMEQQGWDGTAQELGSKLQEAIDSHMNGYEIGKGIVSDIASGISDYEHLIAAALKGAVDDALMALNPTSGGSNPSGATPASVASAGSFMGRVGQGMMKSVALGALAAAPEQARIMNNAARYISQAAGAGIMSGGAVSGHTYHQEQTVSVTGNTFMVRSDQDMHQLAYEIAAIMNRRQKGYGG